MTTAKRPTRRQLEERLRARDITEALVGMKHSIEKMAAQLREVGPFMVDVDERAPKISAYFRAAVADLLAAAEPILANNPDAERVAQLPTREGA